MFAGFMVLVLCVFALLNAIHAAQTAGPNELGIVRAVPSIGALYGAMYIFAHAFIY